MLEMDLQQFLIAIGTLTVVYFVFNFIWNLYHAWKVYLAPTYPDFSKYGVWSGKQ